MNMIIAPFIIAIFVFAALAMLGFWLWALVDCIKAKMRPEHKLIWILIIVFLNIIGAILYFILKEYPVETTKSTTKTLTKSSDDKILFGVCGGIAKYTKIDSSIIRIIWILVTIFFNGAGLILYIIAAIIMPQDKTGKQKAKEDISSSFALKFFVAILIICMIFISAIIAGGIMYSTFEQVTVGPKNTVVEVVQETTQKTIEEQIKESYNYAQLGGENLQLIAIEKPPRSVCTTFQKDIATIISYDANCYKYMYEFDTPTHENIKGFEVDVLIIRGQIQEMKFNPKQNETQINYCQGETPEMCAEYLEPVCGYLDNGTSKTFSNECFACMAQVKHYVNGEC